MKIESQHGLECLRLAKAIEPVAADMLTHIDDDGGMVSQPMAPLETDTEGAAWFFTDLRAARVEHLRTLNPGVVDAGNLFAMTAPKMCGQPNAPSPAVAGQRE